MKKYYSLFLFWSLLTGLSTSCSDDNKKDPYLPTPPQVSIGNPSGQTTCLPGETIELKDHFPVATEQKNGFHRLNLSFHLSGPR